MREALGDDEAETLMEHLPPLGWADVATKQDVQHLETVLRSDMGTLETGLRGDMAKLDTGLRGEMSALSATLRGEMVALSATLQGEMSELRADLFREQRNQTYTLVSALAALMAVMLAVLRFT
ncbi:MAG: hypothetical protein WBA45_11525 [Microthrixaceae bacterium]